MRLYLLLLLLAISLIDPLPSLSQTESEYPCGHPMLQSDLYIGEYVYVISVDRTGIIEMRFDDGIHSKASLAGVVLPPKNSSANRTAIGFIRRNILNKRVMAMTHFSDIRTKYVSPIVVDTNIIRVNYELVERGMVGFKGNTLELTGMDNCLFDLAEKRAKHQKLGIWVNQ